MTRLLMMMISQVQRDRSSFAEPCYVIGDGRLCIFYKARTHGTMRTWLKKSTVLHWLVASVWRMMMHIFMGRCPRSEDIAESLSDLFYCITALSLTARYGGETFCKPCYGKEAFHVFFTGLISSIAGRFCCPTFFLKASTKYSKFWRKTI